MKVINYYAGYSSAFHGFLMAVCFLQGYNHLATSKLIAIIYFAISGISLLALCTRYGLSVVGNELLYEVSLLGKTLKKKNISAVEIRKIEFKRVGWSTKGAYLYYSKNHPFPLRLINYKPQEMYDVLLLFAKNNQIPVSLQEEYEDLPSGMTKNS